ncbi:MAG TPA: DUF418 domain-containing protein [Candidatus Limnocylindria bacterium]|nr:DUF418 domain-containing protein [Candidatus Limnocylindria bacterium]
MARALAILGMMVVHFMLVMTDGMPPERWSDFLLGLLDGRATATFVILAGMGVTFMSRKANGQTGTSDRKTMTAIMRRRGLLLMALGFLNLTLWEGDILRVYGVSLLIVPWLIWRSSRTVLLAALGSVLIFGVLFFVMDYGRNWDWNTMTYHGLWTVSGLWRNLFYDGFRSVFPWTGLLLFGAWLGRLDWSTAGVPRRAVLWGAILLVSSTAVSRFLLHWFGAHPQPGFDPEETAACFGLQSMPPLPLFLLNATGFALGLIGASTLVATRWNDRWLVKSLSATGRLAFTWYVAHILVGLGGVIMLGWTRVSHLQALFTALTFFSIAVVASLGWRSHFANGPMEFILRRVGQW